MMKLAATIILSILALFVSCENEVSPPEVTTGTVSGTAVYEENIDNSGITILLEKADGTGTYYTTSTTSTGFYMIQNVVEGYYTVQASSPNSSKKAKQSVTVRRGETSTVQQLVLDHPNIDAKPIQWLGSFAGDPPTPTLYAAYYNTTDGNSYIYDGEKWTMLASHGATGDTGPSGLDGRSMEWKGSLAEHPEAPEELWAYYNTTDGNAYIYTDSVWLPLIENVSISYDEPTIVGSVADSTFYNLSNVFIKVVDETTKGTAYNGRVAADGDFAVSGLDQTRTYTLYFSSEKLSDVNIDFSTRTIAEDNTSTTYGAIRTGVRPIAGKAQNIGEVTLSANGTVMGAVTLSGQSDYSGIDVYLEGTGFATETAADGSWIIGDIPQGIYTVRFYKDGYSHEAKDIILYDSDPSGKPVKRIEAFELPSLMGSISGVVYVNNSDGSPSGVEVKASNADGIHTYTVYTEEDGSYSIPQVYYGDYTATFTKDGYEKYTKTDLTVSMGQESKVSPTLSLSYGSLRITASYSDRDDHSGIVVNVFRHGSLVFSATTTETGVVVVEDLQIGPGYSITASADGYGSSGETDVSVESGSISEVALNRLTNKFGSLSGAVMDSYGKPVEEATVLLKSEKNSYTLTTDSEGNFSKADVLADEYEVSVGKEGYSTQILPVKYVVESSIQMTIPDITLTSIYGTLIGFVVDEFDSWIEDAIVKLNAEDGTATTTSTDEDGNFSVKLKKGTYDVSVSKAGYVSQYFNNVAISPEQTIQLGMISLATGTAGISGRVVLSGETDFSDVFVTLISPANGEIASTVTTANGFYSFMGIDEGEYVLRFQKDGFVTDLSVTLYTFGGVVAQAPVVTLRSTRATVSGTITLDGSNDHSGITVQLVSVDSSQSYSASTLQSGSFLITEVEPGTYDVKISMAGYEGRVLENVFIENSAQKVFDPIMLSIAFASISGTVELEMKDDWAGALVTATSLVNPARIYTAMTNSAGMFSFAQMYPGEYRISIIADGYVSTTLPTIEVVDEKEVSVGSVLLKIARGTITGMVRLEGCTDHSGVKVMLPGTDFETTTVEDGSYSLNVPAGNYPGGIRYEFKDFESSSHVAAIALQANSTYAVPDVELKCLNIPYVSGSVTIRGVSDGSYGGVLVRIVELPEFIYVTGNDGKWYFEHVPVGKYTLEFERENARKATKIVDFSAASSITVENIELDPNSVTLVGRISLDSITDYSGVAVSVTTPGQTEVSTTTDSQGNFSISNIDASKSHTISFEKGGWNSVSFEIEADAYEPLSVVNFTDEHEVVLYDTTAPVLTDIVASIGRSTANGREISLNIYAYEEGSGIKYIQPSTENSFEDMEMSEYYSPYIFIIPDELGQHTIYVRVEDASGNISNVFSVDIVVSDVYTELHGPFEGEMLTLTRENSPYRVSGNILIKEGSVLNIQPGVEIQVAGDYYVQVEGAITAIGTEDEVINIYGVGDGVEGWSGINILSESGNRLSHVKISDIRDGVEGVCDIDNAMITADGNALDITGDLLDSTISGSICVVDGDVMRNNITGGTVALESPTVSGNIMAGSIHISGGQVEKNIFEGSSLSFSGASVYNNEILSLEIRSSGSIIVYTSFNGGSVSLESKSVVSNTVFNNCDFNGVNAIINNSNFINCGDIEITSKRSSFVELDFTENFWGDKNTVEIRSKGEDANLSFIFDYEDDFNLTRVDYSNYKETEIEGIGYQGGEFPDCSSIYKIGDTGPAGGLIFYDKGYFSDGWRYLEAAPEDAGEYRFGYSLFATPYTSTEVGAGRYNTELLVRYMDFDGMAISTQYRDEFDEYAARICFDYSYGGYDDWFLPSKDELNLMYENLYEAGLGSFVGTSYWSSSESEDNSPSALDNKEAWLQYFNRDLSGSQYDIGRDEYCAVRPVRAF